MHLDRPLLIHVAAESERRGRVVLAARSAAPNPQALAAAVELARAFETWVECLIIECPDVLALSAHGFARQVSHAGRIGPLSNAAVEKDQSAATALARRSITRLAEPSGVRVATSVARDSLADALSRACATEGPWNIVALAEPVLASDAALLQTLLDDITGATGILCVGAKVDRANNGTSIIVVVEDLERLPHMLRAAERLALRNASNGATIKVLIAGGTAERTAELDGHLRLLLADVADHTASRVEIADVGFTYDTSSEVTEAIRRLRGSIVIACARGIAISAPGTALVSGTELLSVITSPLLLVR